MSKLKLQYFPFGGRAEPARMAFFIRGIEYEDEFISFPKWGQMKKDQDVEWAGIPMLTISDAKSGEKIDRVGQSNSIIRYAGSCPVNNSGSSNTDESKENKDNKDSATELYPKNNALGCLRVDEILDAVEDLSGVLFTVKGDTPEETKQKREEAFNKTWIVFLKRFNDKLERNRKRMGNDKIGYFVGNSMTIADLKVYSHLKIWMSGRLDYVDGNKLILENKDLPNLTTFYKLMSKDEKIIAFEKDFEAKIEKFKAAEAQKN